jgi:hypothetical protein
VRGPFGLAPGARKRRHQGGFGKRHVGLPP